MITVELAEEHGFFGYKATDGVISVFTRMKRGKSGALNLLRRKRWEAREYAAGRYTVNRMTGEVIYFSKGQAA